MLVRSVGAAGQRPEDVSVVRLRDGGEIVGTVEPRTVRGRLVLYISELDLPAERGRRVVIPWAAALSIVTVAPLLVEHAVESVEEQLGGRKAFLEYVRAAAKAMRHEVEPRLLDPRAATESNERG